MVGRQATQKVAHQFNCQASACNGGLAAAPVESLRPRGSTTGCNSGPPRPTPMSRGQIHWLVTHGPCRIGDVRNESRKWIGYARRRLHGNIAGPGFDSPRLHLDLGRPPQPVPLRLRRSHLQEREIMLRLAHRLLSQDLRPIWDRYPKQNRIDVAGLHDVALDWLRQGEPVIIADNVADYTNELYRTATTRPLSYSEYPPSPPPFDKFFIEWNCPAIRFPDGKPFRELGMIQLGCQMQVRDDVANVVEALSLRERLGAKAENTIARICWGYVGLVYITAPNGLAVPVGSIYLLLDANGYYVKSLEYCYVVSNDVQQTEGGSLGSQATILMALGFMQCKNVRRIDATTDEGPTPKWCRRQRVPELKYHVLQIDVNLSAKPRAGERKTEGDRSGKAIHICRGHFAHFIDDGVSQGLFGRRQYGTFWVPAHTRGALEHGRVISTYNVNTPA